MVKALSWAVDVDEGKDVDEGIDEEVVEEVNDKDELVEIDEVDEVDVAVLEVKVEAELDREEVIDVVGVAVVVKVGIADVVSGVEATDDEADEAGEVEPPNVYNDPNGIYSKED